MLCQHIGVAHCAGFYLYQEVSVAALWVKVVCPSSGAKHLKPANAVALADGRNALAVLGDGGVHGVHEESLMVRGVYVSNWPLAPVEYA